MNDLPETAAAQSQPAAPDPAWILTFTLFWLFVGLLIYVIYALYIGNAARKRGYSRGRWFLTSLIGGPFYSIIVLAALPDRSQDERRELRRKEIERELQSASAARPDAGGASAATDSLDLKRTAR